MKASEIASLDWEKGGGLLPAIVQHARSGRVLMLGYVNRAALERTFESGRAWFFSRSRDCLWMKGESSGNTLTIESIDTDCDRDTLLFCVEPAGPTCHLGSKSCFGQAAPTLDELDRIVGRRLSNPSKTSYTARLASSGVNAIAQKVGEEAVEVVLASVAESDDHVANEAADLVFHLIVLLRKRGLRLDDVLRVLQLRRKSSLT